MKKFLLFFGVVSLVIFGLTAFSQDKKDEKTLENSKALEFFKRSFEKAHPSPDPDLIFNKESDLPLSNEPMNPLFLNSTTTIDSLGSDNSPIQNESSIAVNPKNPKNIIASAVDYRDNSSTWVYVSSDAGKTWNNINLKKPFPKWLASNDPSVAFANDGTGYLVYGGFGYIDTTYKVMVGENGVFFSRTTDEGKTWKAHIPIILHKGTQTLDSSLEDKYYITVDNSTASPYLNNLYVPWKRVTPRDSATQIVISRSTDRGDSWSVPVAVSQRLSGSSEDTTYGQSFPLAITGPKGEVYLVWNNGIEHGVGFAKSSDGGITFSAPKIIEKYNIFGITKYLDGQKGYRHSLKGIVRAETYPSIVCDITNGTNRGNLYLTWAADNIPNIYFSRSTDGGDSWSKPVTVHSDTTNDQFWQWLAIDPKNGDLAVMYLDSRNDKNNIMMECYVSYSSDGGKTWIDRRAADISSDLRKNPFSGNSFAGDYSGCAFYDGIIYPSWVDMRNAKSTNLDDDVYTAIVNTKAPVTPENFKVNIIPDKPDVLNLTWKAPAERSFGKPLGSSEFSYSIFRNDTFLKVLDGGAASCPDSGLVPHTLYKYSICAFSGSDSSLIVSSSGFSGGAKRPATPVLLSAKGNNDNSASISVKLPAFREDSTTALANLKTLTIYRDSVKIKTLEISPTDSGKTMELIDKPDAKGYYSYYISVADAENPPNESNTSNCITIYTGPVDVSFQESFATQSLAKYLNFGGWAPVSKFFHSAQYSLNESPAGNYKDRTEYRLTLFPVRNSGNSAMKLEFYHAALVYPKDSAMVEVSKDNGSTWQLLASFDRKSFTNWDDGVLNNDDWKPETFVVPSVNDDTLIFRFRLKTNISNNDDGWFIDDINISGSNSAEDISGNNDGFTFKTYPNPATDRVYLHLSSADDCNLLKFSLFSIYGAELPAINPELTGDNDVSFDVSMLPAGVYFINIKDEAGHLKKAMFSVIK